MIKTAGVFLYKHVLEIEVDLLEDVVRAKKPARLPVVLSAEETARLLSPLQGTRSLMADLLYSTRHAGGKCYEEDGWLYSESSSSSSSSSDWKGR